MRNDDGYRSRAHVVMVMSLGLALVGGIAGGVAWMSLDSVTWEILPLAVLVGGAFGIAAGFREWAEQSKKR